jgi:hypothetical protein
MFRAALLHGATRLLLKIAEVIGDSLRRSLAQAWGNASKIPTLNQNNERS